MVDLYRMRGLIKTLKDRGFELERAESSSQPSGIKYSDMPKGGGIAGDRLADDALTIMEIRQAYQETIEELEDMSKQLEPLISRISDPDDRAVMRLRYLRWHSPDEIANTNSIYMSLKTVYRHLNRGQAQVKNMTHDVHSVRMN